MSLINILTESKKTRVTEDGVFIPISVGDIILTGRFKNKKTKVKSISVNDHGGLVINGKNVLRFRYHKSKEENNDESE